MAAKAPGMGRLIGTMVVFLIIGGPIAASIWHVLSDVLAGQVRVGPVLLAVVLLVVFLVLLGLLARFVVPPAEGSGGSSGPH